LVVCAKIIGIEIMNEIKYCKNILEIYLASNNWI